MDSVVCIIQNLTVNTNEGIPLKSFDTRFNISWHFIRVAQTETGQNIAGSWYKVLWPELLKVTNVTWRKICKNFGNNPVM